MITFPESHKDLLLTDVAVLATIGRTGYPQVTALWFLLDKDGVVKLSLDNDPESRQAADALLVQLGIE